MCVCPFLYVFVCCVIEHENHASLCTDLTLGKSGSRPGKYLNGVLSLNHHQSISFSFKLCMVITSIELYPFTSFDYLDLILSYEPMRSQPPA